MGCRSTPHLLGVVGIGASLVAIAGAQAPPTKLCPPCAAVASVQGAGLPNDALTNRHWAIAATTGVRLPWGPMGHMPGGTRLAGEGAVVVQIDTGVTQHPLLAGSRVDVHAADDLFGAGHRNIDLLLTGLLRFPGHGTKTASVMVGRAAPGMDVDGIAPGVHHVPIRATECVLLFSGPLGELNADAYRVSRALYTAAKGRGPFLRLGEHERVDVVSMSLGEFPQTPGLCDAVKAATDAGVIVIVAAGNQVRHTTYPAKCSTAIAVAGSTFGDTPWSGSAGSAEVAVAAPAEAVWTAAVVNGQPCIEASSGTSFATALVAGLAAEWSVRHPLVEATKANRAVEFRAALRATATPWSNPAWSKRYGAGIVNATALFKEK